MARKFAAAMAGLSGVFMLVIGLSLLGLTQSPRPSSIAPDVYARIKGAEWVVGLICIVAGMLIVRLVMLKFMKLYEESRSLNETLIAVVPVAALGALLSIWVVNYIRTPIKLASQPPEDLEASVPDISHDIVGIWTVTVAFNPGSFQTEILPAGVYKANGKLGHWKVWSNDIIVLEKFLGNEDFSGRMTSFNQIEGPKDGPVFSRVLSTPIMPK